MGKQTSGILGPFSGRLGTAVGYMWKQRACVRSYRPHINFPNTPLQQQQHDWFIAMVRFAATANPALKLGFRHLSFDASMTEGNYFVMRNKQHFHTEEGAVTVDYDKLQIAAGPAVDVYFKSPRFEPNETVCVEFDKNNFSMRSSSEDKVYIYIYSPAMAKGILSAPVARRTKQLSISLPQEWSGTEVHIYGFVVDRDGRASNSTYIGVGRVNHYEDRGRYIPLDNNWQEFVDLAKETNDSADSGDNVSGSVSTQPQHTPMAAADPPGIP